MDIQIEPFDPVRDEAAVLALLRASLGWPDDPFFDELFRWKHLHGPWGPSPAWVAVADDAIVGFRAMMRWQFSSPGGTLRAVRAVDTATAPEAQGQGIFTRLTMHALARLEADGVDFVFNTPNDKSRPGYLKMGWREVGRLVPRVVTPGPSAAIAMLRARQAAGHKPVVSGLGQPAGTTDWKKSAEPLPDGIATERTEAFLAWRYGWDVLGYRTITSELGQAVFRLRPRGASTEAVISDLLVEDRAAAASAVRHIHRRSGGDYTLGLAAGPHGLPVTIPMLGQGPVLTWRAVCNATPLRLDNLRMVMGDVELF